MEEVRRRFVVAALGIRYFCEYCPSSRGRCQIVQKRTGSKDRVRLSTTRRIKGVDGRDSE